MAEPKPNPTPKEEFLGNAKLAQSHLANVERPELRQAVAVAMAEYARRLSENPGGESHASHYKLAGAHEFVDIFYKLSFSSIARRSPDKSQLNYNA